MYISVEKEGRVRRKTTTRDENPHIPREQPVSPIETPDPAPAEPTNELIRRVSRPLATG
jgi:hypothetical protein